MRQKEDGLYWEETWRGTGRRRGTGDNNQYIVKRKIILFLFSIKQKHKKV